ncbi:MULTISPECIES: hypothetical protein [unclassified Nocardioides]|uniref:hypothetical protein n=1 Tax=unclassified Nocardioides TaxID=2615069 RepID=UPI00361997DB
MRTTLRTKLVSVSLLLSATLLTACGEDEGPANPSVAVLAENRVTSNQGNGPLATREMSGTRTLASIESVLRTTSGATIIAYRVDSTLWSAFRIYDQDWKPLTPLLGLKPMLRLYAATPEGFIGYASVTSRVGYYRHWITISLDGQVREVAHELRAHAGKRPATVADVLLPIEGGRDTAYRPSQDRLFRRTLPTWWRRSAAGIVADANGGACASRAFGPLAARTRIPTSIDNGLTWKWVSFAEIPAKRRRFYGGECMVAADRLIIQTSRGLKSWWSTIDRTTSEVLSMHRFGRGWQYILPSGILVTTKDRHSLTVGLMVGTDTTNRHLEFRPAPFGEAAWGLYVLGGDIILTPDTFDYVNVSHDAGRTWSRVDLQMPTD